MLLISHLLASVIVLSFLFIASALTNLENVEVVRHIDMSTQLVIVNNRIKVRNNGPDSIHTYIYVVDDEWDHHLAFIEAFDKRKNPMFVQKVEDSTFKYEISFLNPLTSGETIEFVVSIIVTNYLKSYPKRVKQNEKHMVKFQFNVYYRSIYISHVQSTYLFMGTAKFAVIDGDSYALANDTDYGLRYGPFQHVQPFKNAQSVFHYENNSPFLVAEKVQRFIKVSHWGFVSIWDKINLLHSGPEFIGPYKRSTISGIKKDIKDTAIEGFDSIVPINAFDIYLKDEIGLIWSFKVDFDSFHGTSVSIIPRHILYGGWRTEYEIGYTLPISDYVSLKNNNEYMLTFPLVDRIFENMVIKEAEINVILPEGANFRTVDPFFDKENITETKYCYYFDTICRETVTFKRYNLVERHIKNISIAYYFSQINMLIKPLAIAVSLYIIFILLKVFSSLNLFISIEKPVKFKQHHNNKLETDFDMSSIVKKKNKRNVKKGKL